MDKQRRYFLGRVHKGGRLNDDLLKQSFMSPATVHKREYAWTFTDTRVEYDGDNILFVYSKLNRFHPSGSVTIIDEEHRAQDERPEPNLLIASSPFVYIPSFSGIAYQHVWNQIEVKAFVKRFVDIVRETYNDFFVDCEVEPITDLRTFVARLTAIEKVLEIQAKVHPPNPLFGRAWANLKEYLARRSTKELNIKEKGEERNPIHTQVVTHVQALLAQTEEHPYELSEPIDVTDAAVLMAADGYGRGKVKGLHGNTRISVDTGEAQKSFAFDAEPEPLALFEEAYRHFSSVSDERRMGHT